MTPGRGDRGYATLLDGLLFLVLVSVGAAMAAHALAGGAGLTAARELRSQRLDSAALDTLLVVRGPDGRTLGERIGNSLLGQMAGSGDSDPGLASDVNATLARALGPGQRFNLTVLWRPVPWAGPEARFMAGPPGPEGATRVERRVGLPVALVSTESPTGLPPTPDRLLDRAEEEVRRSLPGPGGWSVDPALRALASDAMGEWLRSGRDPAGWLAENLHPDRARAVLALWRA